jgi:hypothetical protein
MSDSNYGSDDAIHELIWGRKRKSDVHLWTECLSRGAFPPSLFSTFPSGRLSAVYKLELSIARSLSSTIAI